MVVVPVGLERHPLGAAEVHAAPDGAPSLGVEDSDVAQFRPRSASWRRATPFTTGWPASRSAQPTWASFLPSWFRVTVADGSEATSTYEPPWARRPQPAT